MSERYVVKLADEVVITSNDLNAAWDRYNDIIEADEEADVVLWDSAKEFYIMRVDAD